MTKSKGIGRGGKRPGSGPKPSGLSGAQVNTSISIPRMLKYRQYLAGKGEPSSEGDVKRWIKQMFAGELASLDEMIDGDQLGKNDCLQLINF
jgi:hypothetical protein